MSDRANLREEMLIWAHDFKGFCSIIAGRVQQGSSDQGGRSMWQGLFTS